MVFHLPHVVEAEFVGQLDLLERLMIDVVLADAGWGLQFI